MIDITKAKNARGHVRGIIGGSASALIPVPEIQNDSHANAIHKLQVQIIALTDGLVNLTEAVEELQSEVYRLRRTTRR